MRHPPFQRRRAAAGLVLAAATLLASCAGGPPSRGPVLPTANPAANRAAYPAARFAVITDTHVYEPSLGTTGPAFEQVLVGERKLFRQGPEIMDAALDMVRAEAPDFLLVSGDLTKDGERDSHLLVAEKLRALARDGVKVFVVPGNHDVLNPAAFGYDESGAHRVPNVGPAEFAEIYRDAGYGDALVRDPGSLSYVAEPVPGLWLLAVDSASYDHNQGRARPVTGGGMTAARMKWVTAMLERAARAGKAVIVMMHHGVVEHFPGYARWVPNYLVNNWKEIAETLSAHGVRLVFTGHFHAQDVAMRAWPDGRVLYDVETGSSVTWPDPVRFVQIEAPGLARITSRFITSLPSFAARGEDFESFSRTFALESARVTALSALRRFGMAEADAETLAAQAATVVEANGRGDEHLPAGFVLGSPDMHALARTLVGAIRPLAMAYGNDTAPPDNDLTIDLATGRWSP